MRWPGAVRLGVLSLAAVFGLKVVMDVGPLAQAVWPLAGAAEAAAPEPGGDVTSTGKGAQPLEAVEALSCEAPESMAEAISAERALLVRTRDALSAREAEVALAEESLAAERTRLEDLKLEIEAQLERVDKTYRQDLDRLVGLYRNMKPQVAAGIMDEIDLEVAVLVLGAMPERDAAQILASLSLVRARAISKIILERSKLPGDQDLGSVRLQ